MIYTVLYFDKTNASQDLEEYVVEANSSDEAEKLFNDFNRDNTLEIYCIGSYENDVEPDAHSCSANADAYGYCQICGAIVHGSCADYEEHGYDPPGTY